MLLFVARVTIAPRSYVHEPNELSATDTASAPRSWSAHGREEKPQGNPREEETLQWQWWLETSPSSYHTGDLVLLSFGRQGGLGQMTLQLGRKLAGGAKWWMTAAFRAGGACVDFGMLRWWLGLCHRATCSRDWQRVQPAEHRSVPAICASLRRARNLNFKCRISTVTRSPGNYRARNICENHLVTF